MKRGFVATAAVALFAFSLITAALSVLLVQPELSESAQIGTLVESARWAVESGTYQCNAPGSGSQFAKYVTQQDVVQVDGNVSEIKKEPTGFITTTVHLVRDYAPGVRLSKSDTTLYIDACDLDGQPMAYALFSGGNLVASGDISGGSSSYAASQGEYQAAVSDPQHTTRSHFVVV